MPKFLIKASYTTEGAKGLLKEGGTSRRAAVVKPTSGLALSLAVNASGAVRLSTIPLITPEEIDAASKKSVAYRAPGA